MEKLTKCLRDRYVAGFLQIVRVMRIDARGLQRHISADIVINAFYAPSGSTKGWGRLKHKMELQFQRVEICTRV